MNGFKIPMKNPSLYLSSFKTNVLISLSHRNQAVFPCTKILVVVLGKLLFISLTNKKSTFEFNTLRFGKFFNNFSNTKTRETAAKQARGLGTAALYFSFKKRKVSGLYGPLT